LIAWRSHNGTYDLLRLRFENSTLIGELLATQGMLKRSHEELEKRVAERTAELSQTNAELQRLAYIASHDLQEPLRNAANFALLLEARYRDRLDTEGREFLQIIVSGVKHMRALVDDLLSHSRVRTPPQLGPTDCAALLDKVLSNFRSAIAESGASVTRDPLPVVQADASQLEQVFTNLLSNAFKFRGSDPLRVHVGVEARDGEWVFSVRDNGIGIAPRYSTQIFEMFERLHSQAQYPGTGIGLAVCKKIIESHHGRIWVDSEEGRGAAFLFTLPRTGGGGATPGGGGASDRDPAGRGQPG
jgi:light-regulated signal transduction histidine kinase (bacteriophytochrome)